MLLAVMLAGILSINPALAGTTSGLGGGIHIGGGAALVVLMLASSGMALLCVLWVRTRARKGA